MCLAAVGLALPTAACALAPVLGPINASSEYSGQETIEAQINPGAYETGWMISLVCGFETRCKSTEGLLPGDQESHTVSTVVTGLAPDTRYEYSIEASSSAGATRFTGAFESIPAGACPNGCGPDEPFRPTEPPWANQSGNEAAERTLQEQREKEQKEKEATTHASEEPAKPLVTRPRARPACVVPALKGDTLAAAQHKLAGAHCRLGIVHRRTHRHGALRVTRQGTPAGKRIGSGAHIALWMGTAN